MSNNPLWYFSTRNGFSTTSIIRISINWDFTATQKSSKMRSTVELQLNSVLRFEVELTNFQRRQKLASEFEKFFSGSIIFRPFFKASRPPPCELPLGKTVVKSSCFTIIDYLPNRTFQLLFLPSSTKPIFSHDFPSNSPEFSRFFQVQNKNWVLYYSL